MPLFVGYPISYETACDFFSLPRSTKDSKLLSHIQDAGLVLEYVDKGQYILGLEVDLGNLFDHFVTAEAGVLRILERKKDVMYRCKKANIDLSDFMMQPLGHEAWKRVSNPEPYLISF
jgi:hypothetical protein